MKGHVAMIIATTAAILFSNAVLADETPEQTASIPTAGSIKCQGANACKGESVCRTVNNACKGQNDCKGKGWVFAQNTKECSKLGGKIVP